MIEGSKHTIVTDFGEVPLEKVCLYRKTHVAFDRASEMAGTSRATFLSRLFRPKAYFARKFSDELMALYIAEAKKMKLDEFNKVDEVVE